MAFGQFAEAIAKRYRGVVRLWTTWNEPNHPTFLLPQSERTRTAEEKRRDLRQEFTELPFDRKITTLMQLETIAVTQAFDRIAEASVSLGKKIFDSVVADDPAKADRREAPKKEETV